MFGYDDVHTVAVTIGDPTADHTINLFRAPAALEILDAYAICSVGVGSAAGTGYSLALTNGGTVGTAATAVAAAVGGTTEVAWTVNQPKTFTISEGTFAAGQWLNAVYDELGTVAPYLTVVFDYVLGVGA